MTNPDIYLQLQHLLAELQQRLQLAERWSEHPPSAAALASQAPFACDMMPFEQWLQYLFIPRMQMLVDEKLPLPERMALLPMAEMQFQPESATTELLSVIAKLDDTIKEHNTLC